MIKKRLLTTVTVAGAIITIVFIAIHITKEHSLSFQPSSPEALKSLPYADWSKIPEEDAGKSGVTKYDTKLAFKGLNMYLPRSKPGGYILDMHGNTLHTFKGISPWLIIEPCKNGHFLVSPEGMGGLFMIDWNSNVVWKKEISTHHDFAISDNGDIYALSYNTTTLSNLDSTTPILDDHLVILANEGEIKKEISFAKMVFQHKVFFDAAKRQIEKRENLTCENAWDLFHTNTIEIIDRDIYREGKRLFKKGDVLFCMRHLNLIGVVGIKNEKIIWSWGMDELDYPHHPSLLENGNILIFDNGYHRRHSRIIELNPVTEEIEWEYKANSPESFYSKEGGSAQRLPNGNTLVTESLRGRVFEITHDGTIVWEFYNPAVDKEKNERANIYRMMRIVDPENHPSLKNLEQ